MKLFQSFCVLVLGPDSKRITVEPLRFRSNDLIDLDLYVSVTKTTRPNFGRRLKTASAKSSKLSGMDVRLKDVSLCFYMCHFVFVLLSVFFTFAFANDFGLFRLIGLWRATVWLTILSCMNSSILAVPILQVFSKFAATSGLAGSPLDKQYNSSAQRSVLNWLVKEQIASMTF